MRAAGFLICIGEVRFDGGGGPRKHLLPGGFDVDVQLLKETPRINLDSEKLNPASPPKKLPARHLF